MYEAWRQPARSHSTGVTVELTMREALEPSPISSSAIAFSGPLGTQLRFMSEPAGTNGPWKRPSVKRHAHTPRAPAAVAEGSAASIAHVPTRLSESTDLAPQSCARKPSGICVRR